MQLATGAETVINTQTSEWIGSTALELVTDCFKSILVLGVNSYLSSGHTHTRARARTHTHTLAIKVGGGGWRGAEMTTRSRCPGASLSLF